MVTISTRLTAASLALAALLTPAVRADTSSAVTLDGYTEQPASLPLCDNFWMFQPLVESCYHRTIQTTELQNGTLTVGSGKLELQGLLDSGEVRVSTSCGPVTGALVGCDVPFGAPYPGAYSIELTHDYDRVTMDFELHSSDPISIGVRFGGGTTYGLTDYSAPGQYTLDVATPSQPGFMSELELVIVSNTTADLDIELEPMMLVQDYPAPYVTETYLDDFTLKPGTKAGTCSYGAFWFIEQLAPSSWRTVFSYDALDPVITIGSGTVELQSADFLDNGQIDVFTTGGLQAGGGDTEGCFTFPAFNYIPPANLGNTYQWTVDVELRSTSSVNVIIQLYDGTYNDTKAFLIDTPGSYTLEALSASFPNVSMTAIELAAVTIYARESGPLDIELGPLTMEDHDNLLFYCPAGTSASGCNPFMWVKGASSGNLVFEVASGLENDKDGLFFYGVNGRQMNPWGNGTSLQCVVPPVTRLPLLNSGGSPFVPCTGSVSMDISATQWCAGCPQEANRPPCGTPVQVQYWYRDPMNTSKQTTSLTGAVEFVMP